MPEFDLLKANSAFYQASETPEVVVLGAAQYLTLRGQGAPGQPVFYEKIAVLRQAVGRISAGLAATGQAFGLPVLEVLYWYEEQRHPAVRLQDFYTSVPLRDLHYRLMLRVPASVTPAHLAQAAHELVGQGEPLAAAIEPFTFTVGRAVQVLHVGPLANEPATLAALDAFMRSQNLRKAGLHHEIHLVDLVRHADQTHYQTILRDQVAAQ